VAMVITEWWQWLMIISDDGNGVAVGDDCEC
jgi:hypothetical protein